MRYRIPDVMHSFNAYKCIPGESTVRCNNRAASDTNSKTATVTIANIDTTRKTSKIDNNENNDNGLQRKDIAGGEATNPIACLVLISPVKGCSTRRITTHDLPGRLYDTEISPQRHPRIESSSRTNNIHQGSTANNACWTTT